MSDLTADTGLPQRTRGAISALEKKAPEGARVTIVALTLDQLIVHDSGIGPIRAGRMRQWDLIEPVLRFAHKRPYPRTREMLGPPIKTRVATREWVVFLDRRDGSMLQNYQLGPAKSDTLCATTMGWQR